MAFADLAFAWAQRPVELSADATDWPAVALGNPEPHVGMREERIVPGIEVVQALEHQRRHPDRIIAVEAGRDLEKPDEIAAALHRADRDRRGRARLHQVHP